MGAATKDSPGPTVSDAVQFRPMGRSGKSRAREMINSWLGRKRWRIMITKRTRTAGGNLAMSSCSSSSEISRQLESGPSEAVALRAEVRLVEFVPLWISTTSGFPCRDWLFPTTANPIALTSYHFTVPRCHASLPPGSEAFQKVCLSVSCNMRDNRYLGDEACCNACSFDGLVWSGRVS